MNRHPTTRLVAAGACVLALALSACDRDATPEKQAPPSSSLPETYWLATEPAGAKQVAEVRENAKTGDEVVVTGVVGGRKAPFTEGAAAFTIVDHGEKKCTPGECEAPWDFCCTPPDRLAKATVMVEVHEDGRLIRKGARGFHGLDHMKEVTVKGKASKDEAGNVTIVANGIHVRP